MVSKAGGEAKTNPQPTPASTMSVTQMASPSLIRVPKGLTRPPPGLPSPCPRTPHSALLFLLPFLPDHPQTIYLNGAKVNVEKILIKDCVPHRRALSLLPLRPGPRSHSQASCMALSLLMPHRRVGPLGHGRGSLALPKAHSHDVPGYGCSGPGESRPLQIFPLLLPNIPSFQKQPGLKIGDGTASYLIALAELEVRVGGQGVSCALQGLSLVATTQLWSGFLLHAPTTCWEDRSVTGEQ